jgi:hypothetical protein
MTKRERERLDSEYEKGYFRGRKGKDDSLGLFEVFKSDEEETSRERGFRQGQRDEHHNLKKRVRSRYADSQTDCSSSDSSDSETGPPSRFKKIFETAGALTSVAVIVVVIYGIWKALVWIDDFQFRHNFPNGRPGDSPAASNPPATNLPAVKPAEIAPVADVNNASSRFISPFEKYMTQPPPAPEHPQRATQSSGRNFKYQEGDEGEDPRYFAPVRKNP